MLILSGSVTTNLTTNLTLHYFLSLAAIYSQSCADRASAAFYVCILLHNTYIHTYIPPLGGVCMYVCMYIVKNYILYNMYLCIYYNSVEFEKLMLKLSLKLSLKWNLLSLTSDLISWSAHWVLIELRFELKSLTFCKFWRSFDWNLEKSRKFPY